MSEPDYIVRARIVVEDTTAPASDAAQRSLRGLEVQAGRTGQSISSTIGRAFAALVGTGGIGLAVRGMVGLNSEIQTAQNGLATLFSAVGRIPIASGIRIARGELQALRRDAAAGVGELGDYLGAYQMVLTPGLNAGKSLGDIRSLVRNALAAGAALRGEEGLRFAPMDLVQAMTGQAGMRTTPIVAQALSAAGISMEKFRAGSQAQQFDDLQRAFAAFAPGVELMGRSWEAQFSTLRDNAKNLIRTVTSPLFDRWTQDLIRANDWLAKNEATIARVAGQWGQKLIAVWDHLIRQAGTYAAIVAAVHVAPGVSSVVGGMAAGRTGKLASEVWEGAKWGASLPGRGGILGQAAGGLAGGAGALWAALGPLGQVALRAAGPLAAVGVAFTSVVGAAREFPGVLADTKASVMGVITAFGSLGTALSDLTGPGSAINLIGGALLWVFGRLADAAGLVVRSLATVVEVFALVFKVIGDGLKGAYYAATGQFGKAASFAESNTGRWNAFTAAFNQIWNRMPRAEKAGELGIPGGLDGLNVPNNNINIGTVNMNVKTEVNADPDRVLTALAEGLDRIRVFGSQARGLPALGV